MLKNVTPEIAWQTSANHFWLPEYNHRLLPMKALTSQEKIILELIGQGYSSGQIAYSLQISSHTVESHRKNLLLKFDAKNSAELIRKAIQHKVLNPNGTEDEHP